LIVSIAVGLVMLSSTLLFLFGLNVLFLTWRATRLTPKPSRPVGAGEESQVCVQIPIYNERYVAERVIEAVCALDWPKDRLEVQVLDDSDDDTSSIVERRVNQLRRQGYRISHVVRGSRKGFKAGALAHGMSLTSAPFMAIFDADFVPPRDFLRRTMTAFEDPVVGFAQARWGHLDEGYSWFTRLQALAIDYHFMIEQAARSRSGYFTNFTGTAGVWRRTAIEDAGGWSAATLTEDLDLSYRAQLRGWKAAFLEDLVVPEELPVSIDAYRSQQSRWATGSFQTAFRLLGPVLRSPVRASVKLQATLHLLAYGIGPLMLLQLAAYTVLLLVVGRGVLKLPWFLAGAPATAAFISVAPWIGFMAAQTRRGRRWWSGLPALACQVVGAGMSITVVAALFRALRPGGRFVRTPKHRIEARGQEWRDQEYVRVGDARALLEGAFGLCAAAVVPLAVSLYQGFMAVYAAMFAGGLLLVAGLSAVELLEVLTLRRLGRLAFTSVRKATPLVALFGLAGLLLLFSARMPEPFEDGYGHWLMAANLAATGQLRDPIFGMQDTWLPLYHVIAAGVLSLLGLWQLGALKILGACFGLATLACTYRIAPSRSQGRLAALLLLLNPVFLFTSGSAVVEPLLAALLTGGALAAVRGRMKLAALMAALACTTSTKAWIWVGGAAAFALIDALRRRAPARVRLPAMAWAVPAVGVLVFMQLSFAPASHSVARGSIELLSATARGSAPVGAMARLSELIGTYGLAALPVVGFAAIGLAMAWRQKASRLLTFIYLPALVYLAAVVTLIGAGVYTGSHRYLYPVLPAFALLAAGALDRYSAVLKAVVVAASGLLAVGFLPVFMGFAADNAGLVAAGRAASGSPGVLMTDSPVVAFYSGRPPDQIAGSQALPPDRSSALAWMQSRGVTALVLENISYYRAAVVFPDLASGSPAAPFSPLGVESRYQASGGKVVYGYRLGAGLNVQSIYPGVDAAIGPMPSDGKTAALAKGVYLRISGVNAAGEGMGFGVPIVHYADGWVYSRTAVTSDLSIGSTTVWRRTFELDEIGGDAAHDYRFAPVASRGEVQVTYVIDSSGFTVTVTPLWLAPGSLQVGVLNEQSAAFADFAAAGQPAPLIGAKFGNWVPVAGDWARLRSASLGLEWSVPAVAGSDLHGGRELVTPNFNWAGLDYLFPATFTGTTYRVTVQEAR
jgi:cellulose synthase/poly-beta-1,6-N-acetylglucosamine synthase-like glycosyltransferase